jgi:hypothetical protein
VGADFRFFMPVLLFNNLEKLIDLFFSSFKDQMYKARLYSLTFMSSL